MHAQGHPHTRSLPFTAANQTRTAAKKSLGGKCVENIVSVKNKNITDLGCSGQMTNSPSLGCLTCCQVSCWVGDFTAVRIPRLSVTDRPKSVNHFGKSWAGVTLERLDDPRKPEDGSPLSPNTVGGLSRV